MSLWLCGCPFLVNVGLVLSVVVTVARPFTAPACEDGPEECAGSRDLLCDCVRRRVEKTRGSDLRTTAGLAFFTLVTRHGGPFEPLGRSNSLAVAQRGPTWSEWQCQVRRVGAAPPRSSCSRCAPLSGPLNGRPPSSPRSCWTRRACTALQQPHAVPKPMPIALEQSSRTIR